MGRSFCGRNEQIELTQRRMKSGEVDSQGDIISGYGKPPAYTSEEDFNKENTFSDNESTLSYLINLQDTKLENEKVEETYLNNETTQLIEDRLQERKNLERLGKLIPITTPTEPVIIRIAEQRSTAFPVPLRVKKAETAIMVDPKLSKNRVTLVQNRTSLAMEARAKGSTIERTSIVTGANEVKARVSKTVEFGMAKQTEVEDLTAEWDDILLDKSCFDKCNII